MCDFVAIFDADFQPEFDFLLRTVPFLVHNPEIGLVQARWKFGKCLFLCNTYQGQQVSRQQRVECLATPSIPVIVLVLLLQFLGYYRSVVSCTLIIAVFCFVVIVLTCFVVIDLICFSLSPSGNLFISEVKVRSAYTLFLNVLFVRDIEFLLNCVTVFVIMVDS